MELLIRPVSLDDAPSIAAIYAPFCEASIVSFEEVAPTADEMRGRIAKIIETHPWLVAEIGGNVVGYAYAGQHRDRAAYRWSTNVTVYLDPSAHRKGIGTALYRELFADLRNRGYCRAFGGITLPNEASVGLHQSLGFEPVGIYRRVGFKYGQWHDTMWLQLDLRSDENPAELRGIRSQG